MGVVSIELAEAPKEEEAVILNARRAHTQAKLALASCAYAKASFAA
jgi:hypothetical protein